MLATKALDDYDQIRTKARREMFDLLTAEPEPVATKAVKPTCPGSEVRLLMAATIDIYTARSQLPTSPTSGTLAVTPEHRPGRRAMGVHRGHRLAPRGPCRHHQRGRLMTGPDLPAARRLPANPPTGQA